MTFDGNHTNFIITTVGRPDVYQVYLLWQVVESSRTDPDPKFTVERAAADGTVLFVWHPMLFLDRARLDEHLDNWLKSLAQIGDTAAVIDLTGPMVVHCTPAGPVLHVGDQPRPVPVLAADQATVTGLQSSFEQAMADALAPIFAGPLDVNAGPLITVCTFGHEVRWSKSRGEHWKHITGNGCPSVRQHTIPTAKLKEIRKQVASQFAEGTQA
jgi:hypothetical protein